MPLTQSLDEAAGAELDEPLLLLSDPHAESASAPATTTPPSAANRVPFFTGKSPPELMGGGIPVFVQAVGPPSGMNLGRGGVQAP
jgi:hypothetical protein